jgi:hypothetical protein
MHGDSITVLRCARGLRLAKMIRSTGMVDYDSTRTFDAWEVKVATFDDLCGIILRLIDRPRFCIVRGALINGPKATKIRRLVHADPKTGDAATLRDVPHRWVALDIEGISRPEGIDATDLIACARHALQRLPVAFRDAACLVQATAGHGIKPDLRLRVWFWLSRLTTGAELNRWLRGAPADASIFRSAQIIYTAAPVFEGCEDHLPVRIVRLAGSESVMVPSATALAPQPRQDPKPLPAPDSPRASAYAWAALRNAVVKVRNAPINSRHPECLAQSRNLARFVNAGLLSEKDMKDAMSDAIFAAGKTREEGEAITVYALSHPSTSPLPEGIR